MNKCTHTEVEYVSIDKDFVLTFCHHCFRYKQVPHNISSDLYNEIHMTFIYQYFGPNSNQFVQGLNNEEEM